MRSSVLYLIIAIFVFLTLSCGDFLENINEDQPRELIIINSLKDGDVISRDYTISFKILTPQTGETSKPDTETDSTGNAAMQDTLKADSEDKTAQTSRLILEIYLYDNAGLVVLKKVNSDFETDIEYTLDIASGNNIDTGLYALEFILSEDAGILAKKTITFFYSIENYIINGIESFPPVIYPHTTVEIKADLIIPEDSNPFLRWKEKGKLLYSGLYSEGLSTILWTAPAELGVYSITLEVFPAGPFNAKDFLFASDNSMGIELFVTELQKANIRNLTPPESYYTLFHLAGDTKDAAGIIKETKNFTSRNLEAAFIGKPLLVVKEDDLGYKLDGSTGLQIPAAIFPVTDGKLQPFTLTLALEPDRVEEQGNIVTFKSNDNSSEFRLFTDKELFYRFYFKSNLQEFTATSRIKLDKQRFLLSVSVLPGADYMEVTWYYDGIHQNSLSRRFENKNVNNTGTTIIGGNKGFSGTIYELGVYYKDLDGKNAVDQTLFQSIARQKYPDSYLFADGFDSTNISGEYNIKGKYEQQESQIRLFADTTFNLPAIPLEDDIINITVYLKEWNNSGINLKLNDKIILTFSSAGEISKDNKTVGAFIPDELFYLKIDSEQAQILIPAGTELVVINVPELQTAASFNLEFFNRQTAPLSVDYVMILKAGK